MSWGNSQSGDSAGVVVEQMVRLQRGGHGREPGALGRSIPVPRAKVIGGCTTHNAVVAGRGTPEDYDQWSRLGNPGWSFEQLLDDFRRYENDPDGDIRNTDEAAL